MEKDFIEKIEEQDSCAEGKADVDLQPEELQEEEYQEALEEEVPTLENTVPLTKKELNQCRHKVEKRWYRRLCVLNLLIVIAAIGIIVYLAPDGRMEELAKASDNIATEEDIEDVLAYCVTILLVILAIPLIVNYQYQQYRMNSIRITEKNFPDIYERIQIYAKRMNLKKVPEVYIVQQNGILNAFSSFVMRKQYVEIYADIFEVAYREYQDIDAISFIIAHEMAHIKYKHATYWYNIKIWFADIVPILGSAASRAREYSCDRLAQKVTGNDGIQAMFILMTGKHLYRMVDEEDYLEYARSANGFFAWCVNLVSSHPVMPKRILALKQGEGSGKLY